MSSQSTLIIFCQSPQQKATLSAANSSHLHLFIFWSDLITVRSCHSTLLTRGTCQAGALWPLHRPPPWRCSSYLRLQAIWCYRFDSLLPVLLARDANLLAEVVPPARDSFSLLLWPKVAVGFANFGSHWSINRRCLGAIMSHYHLFTSPYS